MIAAIDPASTKIAICIDKPLSKRKVLFFEDKLPSPYSPRSSSLAAEYVRGVFSTYGGDGDITVFLEAPIVARNHQSTIKQAMVSGAIQAALVDLGCEVRLVPITKWKKEVVGKGNATKDEVREWAESTKPKLKGESQDIVDAFCIYVYGTRIMNRAEHL